MAGVEREAVLRPAVRRHGGTGAVGGQLDLRRQAAQPLPPIGDVALQHLAGEPAALPEGEVGVLHRQLRQRRRPAVQRGGVEGPHLPHQHAHRPAVRDDVVEGQQQLMPPGGEPQQDGAQQRPAGKIERTRRLGRGEPIRLPFPRRRGQPREVGGRQLPGPGGEHHLHGLAVPLGEDGAQRLVPAGDLAEGGGQGGGVQLPLQPQDQRQVVEGLPRLQTVEEPEPLLGEGEGERGIRRRPQRARRPRNGPVGRRRAGGERRLHRPRQLGHGRPLEQAAQGDLDAERLAHPRHHLGGQQRMPAQLEEVVVDAHPPDAQHLAPDRRHQLLGGIARLPGVGLPVLGRGRRQGPAVHLAAGGERQVVEPHPERGDHGVRQPLGEPGA